jgi:hypothetical protein
LSFSQEMTTGKLFALALGSLGELSPSLLTEKQTDPSGFKIMLRPLTRCPAPLTLGIRSSSKERDVPGSTNSDFELSDHKGSLGGVGRRALSLERRFASAFPLRVCVAHLSFLPNSLLFFDLRLGKITRRI